ncbi:NADH-quinone oxidoreductase subunit 5 family protein [Sphingobacterium haloxyli]|uniref:NADH-quinone oxidoreductase subunit L n=1 Tax=Sphingobacterium haloxyli TaxID=2100533 RepID=A0A2S9J0F0_9SPHI|nr:NADH-quinone oxidoreductase subunit L [Sphingobacterium haloxyli]PRD46230.1 NADH-quinone oxidoreductase subunit L [Sphingobacterium haloxyli]
MNTFVPISPIIASILVISFPLLAFVLQAMLGKKAISGNMALIAILGSTIISLFGVFLPVWNNTSLQQKWEWFTIGDHTLHVGILVNNLTALMQLVVCVIALPVHIYSRAYMKGDTGIHRYWMYLSLFCFAMLGLTVSLNLLQLYIFWELVGFASYLLIGFWFTRETAAQANKKAFIINRIGDLGFLIGIALVYAHCGTLDLSALFNQTGFFKDINIGLISSIDKNAPWVTFAGLAFFLGAMAKSAQFPLHVWLPDAMEGPTSVSSLIHAATMVAAGVFLLCTVFPLFNETVLLIIVIIGTLTALTAALFALGQYDIKKVLAFSTISQLGFMMVGVGIGSWDAAMFHLTTHAFFKCLLFLSAGAIIHEMAHLKTKARLNIDPQDLRHLGGLRRFMPKTFFCMAIASLSLAGFPFTSGYLSKDSIVITAYEWAIHFGGVYVLIPIVLIIVSILTAFYIGRLIFKAFFGSFKYDSHVQGGFALHEAPGAMLIPMFFLAAASLFPLFGLSLADYHSSWIMQTLDADTAYPTLAQAHLFIPAVLTGGAILAWLVGWHWYAKAKYPLSENNRLVHFANKQGYLNEFNERIFVKGTLKLSRMLYIFDRYAVDGTTKLFSWFVRRLSAAIYWFDKYIVDGLVNSFAQMAYYIGHLVRHVQNGQLQGYLGFALTVVILGILYLIIT